MNQTFIRFVTEEILKEENHLELLTYYLQYLHENSFDTTSTTPGQIIPHLTGYSEVISVLFENQYDKNNNKKSSKDAFKRSYKWCRLQVKNKVDKNLEKNVNRNFFHFAALEVYRILFQNQIDKKQKVCNGWTIFHQAAFKGHTELCKIFVENVANKNPKTNTGRTPLHLAAQEGHSELCNILLVNKVEKKKTNAPGF